MHKYFINTPWIVKKLFSSYEWEIKTNDDTVYLTFDDGPHPEITPWVLEELKNYKAQATFFCIGKNVEQFPETYKQIIDEGHSIGNHTYTHLNGWKTKDREFLDDVTKATSYIKSNLFRPPYGRLKTSQATKISSAMGVDDVRIIMWDVLSADFDSGFTPEQCFDHVARHTKAGSIIVFHDSDKAFKNLQFALPASLKYLSEKGYSFRKI